MAKFFNTPKPRQFDYRPRYYDPEKEARDKRREEILGKRAPDGEYVPGEMLRNRQMKRMIAADEGRHTKRKKGSTLMLIILLVLLGLAVVWMFS